MGSEDMTALISNFKIHDQDELEFAVFKVSSSTTDDKGIMIMIMIMIVIMVMTMIMPALTTPPMTKG